MDSFFKPNISDSIHAICFSCAIYNIVHDIYILYMEYIYNVLLYMNQMNSYPTLDTIWQDISGDNNKKYLLYLD